ncbi:MAG: heavy-metal-associated domain-containing protein [Firmicutes bacterium]|nr:heavy-metal-associated domain-containing protein [Bacillota bacterium]
MPKIVKLSISGMSCSHCKMRVEKALVALTGVESAVVDLSAGEAEIKYDPGKVSEEELRAAVTEAGYDVK